MGGSKQKIVLYGTARCSTVLYQVVICSTGNQQTVLYQVVIKWLQKFRSSFIIKDSQHKLLMLTGYSDNYVTMNHATNDNILYKLK